MKDGKLGSMRKGARYGRGSKSKGYDLANMPKVKEIFEEQLKKCRVDYFDFYLFHNICEMNVNQYLDAYYFDIPFDETVRRHQTRSKATEFGADEMRDWWKEKDYLDLIKETTITEEKSKDEIVNEIYSSVFNG